MDPIRCEDVKAEMVSWIRQELAAEEEPRFRLHLQSCASCRSEEAMQAGLLETFAETTALDPSPGFRDRVVEAFRREVGAKKPSVRVASPSGLFLAFLVQRARQAPFLVAAVAAHAAVFFVLACIYIPARIAVQPPVEVGPGSAAKTDDQGKIDQVQENASAAAPGAPTETVEIPPLPVPPLPFPHDEVAVPGAQRPPGPGKTPGAEDFGGRLRDGPERADVLGWFGARFDEEKKAKSAEGAASRESLRRALKWLADAQGADGSWDPAATGGRPEFRVGVSGLAALALLGDGNALGKGAFADATARAVAFLLDAQDPESGRFGPAQGNYMYNHAIALLAVGEAYGAAYLHRPADPAVARRMEAAAGNGVRWMLKAQRRQGGWGYFPGDPEGDTSVTAWAAASLATAIRLKLVPGDLVERADRSLEKSAKWFRHVTNVSGVVGYRKPGVVKTAPHSLTAVSLYCRGLYIETVTPEWKGLFEKQVRMVASRVPGTGEKPDFYFWYYAAYGLQHCQAAEAAPFLARLRETLPAFQEADGGFTGNALYADYAGRAFTTAMAAMILELPFRYGR
jgi:hypothetical protein